MEERGVRLDDSLRTPLASALYVSAPQIPCSASPGTGSYHCLSESRNVQGSAVGIPLGVKKNLVTTLVGTGFWLTEG